MHIPLKKIIHMHFLRSQNELYQINDINNAKSQKGNLA